MSLSILLFVAFAVVLAGLLAWAVRPPRHQSRPASQILETLSEERHYCRLPQILHALGPDDIAYLRMRGHHELVRRLRRDRRRVGLRFVNLLQEDFETLLDASRVLATMSPELIPMQEFERLKLSMRFAFYCRFLQWKLRLGLAPSIGFGKVSEMASDMAFRLESATSRIGDRAIVGSESPSVLH